MKSIKLGQLASWMDKIALKGNKSTKWDNAHNTLVAELPKLTKKQLTALATFVSQAYGLGCNDTREWFADYKKMQKKYEKSGAK